MLRPSWIAFGWFLAAAVTALVLLGLTALGILDANAEGAALDVWMTVALLIGFWAGGFLTGARVGAAPVLHGVGIGLVSLAVWLLANLLLGEAAALTGWTALSLPLTLALLLLQMVAATAGAWTGVRWTRGG